MLRRMPTTVLAFSGITKTEWKGAEADVDGAYESNFFKPARQAPAHFIFGDRRWAERIKAKKNVPRQWIRQ